MSSFLRTCIGLFALGIGLVNTGLFLVMALLVASLGGDANWVARAWANTAYWLIYRLILQVKLQLEVDDPSGIVPHQSVVVVMKHPSTPEVFGCMRAMYHCFPKLHIAPVGRDNHFLSSGWRAVGGIVINREDRAAAIQKIRQSIAVFHRATVVLIFPEGHRFTRKRWRMSSQRWRYLLDPKWLGVDTIANALPEAAYFRGVVCFDRPVYTVWQAGRLWRATLLVKLTRVEPPAAGMTKTWLDNQFDYIEQEVSKHQSD